MVKVKQLSPDAVILDVLLPRVDGWEFLTQVKANPATRGVPVIIVSIIDQKGKGFALGAADYLIKPIQKGELLRTLGTFSLTSKVRTAPVNILLIDDDPKAVELLAMALEPEGFHVLRAYNGETGVAMAETEQPDLIILDLLMPGMNGFEVLDHLAQSPVTRRLPILIFTVKQLTIEEKQRLQGRIAQLAQKTTVSQKDVATMVKDTLRRTLGERDIAMPGELILIVEDNPRNLKLIRDVLQFQGYATLEAATGEAGVSLALERQPALILMDVQLPGMDGSTAMKALKADMSTRHIPIIALTALTMKGDAERLLAEGFDGYIAKPITIKEVPKMVERYVQGQL